MAVKVGYKQTEVGEIPVDWESVPLSEVFNFKQGVQTPIEKQNLAPSESRKRFIRIIDLTNPGEGRRYILDPGKQHHVSPTDLFMVRYGAPGLVGIGFEGVIANNLFRLLPKRRVEGRYYFQYLNSKQDELAGLSGSTTMPAINFSTLSVFEVPLPPTKAEQEAIAEALSDADALIESLEQLIAKKRQIKQGAMQQLLTGQKRLPGFSGGWSLVELGSLSTMRGGMTPSMANSDYWLGGSIPWVTSGDVKSTRLDSTLSMVTENAVSSKATTLVPKGSIVMVMRSGILRRYFPVSLLQKPMAINQDIKVVLPNKSFVSEFLLQLLMFKGPEILSTCLKSGTTVESVELGWLKSFEIPLPMIVEQTAIAETLSEMDEEVATLESKLSKARQLKQGMMQELLTGKTRLV